MHFNLADTLSARCGIVIVVAPDAETGLVMARPLGVLASFTLSGRRHTGVMGNFIGVRVYCGKLAIAFSTGVSIVLVNNGTEL